MNFILNIGMAPGSDPLVYPNGLTPEIILERFTAAYLSPLRVKAYEVQDSTSEPTLVITADYTHDPLDPMSLQRWLHGLSKNLEQDCLAIMETDTKRGAIIGPRAAEWGQFDPQYFLTPQASDR